MLEQGQLFAAFSPYLQDIECCRLAGAHWCLLHVVLCVPDICGALESPSGRASPARYKGWCDKYLLCPALTGNEVYRMRCTVLHQGRARVDGKGRYERFAFGKPTGGFVDHLRSEGNLLHVDVEALLGEVLAALDRWIRELEANSGGIAARHVASNIPKLVRVTHCSVPLVVGEGVAGQPLRIQMYKTN